MTFILTSGSRTHRVTVTQESGPALPAGHPRFEPDCQ